MKSDEMTSNRARIEELKPDPARQARQAESIDDMAEDVPF